MANIHCTCGNVFTDGGLPSPYLSTLIPDKGVEDLLDKLVLATKGGDFEAHAGFAIRNAGSDVYECPECSRLLVFESGKNTLSAVYKKEGP